MHARAWHRLAVPLALIATLWPAAAQSGSIPSGASVRVVAQDGERLRVEPIPTASAAGT